MSVQHESSTHALPQQVTCTIAKSEHLYTFEKEERKRQDCTYLDNIQYTKYCLVPYLLYMRSFHYVLVPCKRLTCYAIQCAHWQYRKMGKNLNHFPVTNHWHIRPSGWRRQPSLQCVLTMPCILKCSGFAFLLNSNGADAEAGADGSAGAGQPST